MYIFDNIPITLTLICFNSSKSWFQPKKKINETNVSGLWFSFSISTLLFSDLWYVSLCKHSETQVYDSYICVCFCNWIYVSTGLLLWFTFGSVQSSLFIFYLHHFLTLSNVRVGNYGCHKIFQLPLQWWYAIYYLLLSLLDRKE